MQNTHLKSDYYSEPILNGHASKSYSKGITITGIWAKGLPKGKFDYNYHDISTQITFKNGTINRIHTNKSQLTIYFPYKYLEATNYFIENLDEEANSYYSVLRLNFFHKAIEKPINRRIGPTKRFYFFGKDYFGEFINENFPHGYGIKIFNAYEFQIGYFSCGVFNGKGMLINLENESKGNFYCKVLNGEGIEKVLETGLKYKGNFTYGEKTGLFNVFLNDFRLECRFYLNQLYGPVRYFRNDKFIAECPAMYLTLEHFTDINSSYQLDEFIRLIQSNILIFHNSHSLLKFKQSHENNLKVIKKTKNHLPDVKDWLDYETSIFPKYVQVKSYFDECKYMKFDKFKIFRGFAEDKANFRLGRFTNGSDELYIGEYNGTMRNGLGYFCKKDIYSYRGYWKNNNFHGKGVFLKDDVKISGIWENGNLIKIVNVFIN